MIISLKLALIFLVFRRLLVLGQKVHAEFPDRLAFAKNLLATRLLVDSRQLNGELFTAWCPQRQTVKVSGDIRYSYDCF